MKVLGNLNVVILDTLEEGEFCFLRQDQARFFPKESVFKLDTDCKRCASRFRCLTEGDGFTLRNLCFSARDLEKRAHDPLADTLVLSKNVYESLMTFLEERG